MALDVGGELVATHELLMDLTDNSGTLGYLQRFYHLKLGSSSRDRRHLPSMVGKIKEMQAFFGLKETGHLDPQTLAVMKKDRCGVPDVDNFSLYPNRPKWKNLTVTYRIAKYTSDLRKEEVENSLHMALKIWSDAAPLRFVRVESGKADIIISFVSRGHGDFFPFDGPKGVLAHAFEPGTDIGGDVHFDDDEIWTMGYQKPVAASVRKVLKLDGLLGSFSGYNLFTVAAHELGHSLGLAHSRDPSALMYPNYKYFDAAKYTLPKDDTLGIQSLYGKHTKTQETRPIPRRCHPDFSVDAVAIVGHELLFFKNSYVWLRMIWRSYWNRLKEGFINTYLPSITSPVDAAYNIPARGVAYIFTGPKYWMVQNLKMKSYSGSIYEYGFPLIVKEIDAAVHISEYRKTYFFTGDVYYRYDEARSMMDRGFPRKIQTDWPGIVGRVDAAFELAGTVHVFSGSKAYGFNYRQGRVVYVVRANAWLGC
ncbi:matrix metalloproteinase-20 [Chanos chanos]|uniref:Matrix metalloproteinase-20 n=1 Tax=Chanos chanos TaxID=29144 RepID=A0A6J2VS49_CHACN|nr:matrix metalloproteinase-20-like [Chanos chanos]